jgi:hypothetical protein
VLPLHKELVIFENHHMRRLRQRRDPRRQPLFLSHRLGACRQQATSRRQIDGTECEHQQAAGARDLCRVRGRNLRGLEHARPNFAVQAMPP